MLIDDFMPRYDFSETHDIKIRARAADVFRALNETDMNDSWIIRTLFFLRGLPTGKLTLRDMQKMRFETLGESENKEILLGLAGRFWTVMGSLKKVDSNNFREFKEIGFAKAVCNFSLVESNGETSLTTETRIKCFGEKSHRRFGFYWTFIQPFSGLTRLEMLKLIKRKAEKSY